MYMCASMHACVHACVCVCTEAQDGETSCCYSEGVLVEGDVVACKVMVAVVEIQQQNWA